jgi:hypothetical protein
MKCFGPHTKSPVYEDWPFWQRRLLQRPASRRLICGWVGVVNGCLQAQWGAFIFMSEHSSSAPAPAELLGLTVGQTHKTFIELCRCDHFGAWNWSQLSSRHPLPWASFCLLASAKEEKLGTFQSSLSLETCIVSCAFQMGPKLLYAPKITALNLWSANRCWSVAIPPPDSPCWSNSIKSKKWNGFGVLKWLLKILCFGDVGRSGDKVPPLLTSTLERGERSASFPFLLYPHSKRNNLIFKLWRTIV